MTGTIRTSIQLLAATMCLLVLSSFSSFASTQSLSDLGFKQSQIAHLMAACCGKSALECQLLTSEINGNTKTVVILGEFHNQAKEEYTRGADLFGDYGLIGLEPNEIMRARPGVLASVQRGLSKLPSPYRHSLLHYRNSEKEVVNLEPGFDSGVNLIAGGLLAEVSSVGVALCSSAVPILSPVSIGVAGVALAAMAKGYFNSKISPRGDGMRIRDKFMADTIENTFKSSSETQMASAMGVAHVNGVSRFLKQRGFIERREDIVQACKELGKSPNSYKYGSRNWYYPEDLDKQDGQPYTTTYDPIASPYDSNYAYTLNGIQRHFYVEPEGFRYTSVQFSYPKPRKVKFYSGEENVFLDNLFAKSTPKQKGDNFRCGLYQCSTLAFPYGSEITVYSSDVEYLMEQFH